MTIKIDAKAKFNALANADHIFAYKEDKIPFRVIDIVNSENGCKAVVQLQDGEIKGLFTDAKSAKDALHEVLAVFGNGADAPFITINIKKTAKGQSVYFVEVV